jgi:hypothetical protein
MGRRQLDFRSMASKYGALCLAVGVGFVPVGTACAADDLFDLYVGGSAGRSGMHLDNSWTATAQGSDEVVVHPTGWSASVGIRPLRVLGAEFQYLDFGSSQYNRAFYQPPVGGFQNAVTTSVHTSAEALTAVLYAPIPVRFFDVYAKLGPAHWHSTVNGEIYGLPCPISSLSPSNCGQIAVRQGSTDLVYGAGLQFKLGPAALRVEYERIEAHPEYPYMSQVGLTWTF